MPVDYSFEILNAALFVVGLYALGVFAPYIWRAGLRKTRAPIADAVAMHIVGHCFYRFGTWLNWHMINNHMVPYDWLWLMRDFAALTIGISLVWLVSIMATALFNWNDNPWFSWALPLGVSVLGAVLLFFV